MVSLEYRPLILLETDMAYLFFQRQYCTFSCLSSSAFYCFDSVKDDTFQPHWPIPFQIRNRSRLLLTALAFCLAYSFLCGRSLYVNIFLLWQHVIIDCEGRRLRGSFAILRWEPPQRLSTSHVLPRPHLWCCVTAWCGQKTTTSERSSNRSYISPTRSSQLWTIGSSIALLWMRFFTTRLKNTPPLLLIWIVS